MCINNLLNKFLLLFLLKMENPPPDHTTLWRALRKRGARAPDCPVGASRVNPMMASPTLVASCWWGKDTSWSQDCKPWSLWKLPFLYHKIRSLSTSRFHFTSTEGDGFNPVTGFLPVLLVWVKDHSPKASKHHSMRKAPGDHQF